MPDFSLIFIWWLTIFLVGTVLLPLTFLIFKNFADRGYIFSKVLGILLSTYLIWLLGSLHLLPFYKMSLVLVLMALAIINLYIFGKNKDAFFRLPWKWIVIEEIFFFASICLWSFVRGNEPSIRGLEKFMDWGFVNSILRTTYFPPLDMWLTKSPEYAGGHFINYYYFGHYINAFLTKLSGLDSAVTYNLMMNTLYAFTFCLSFSLGLNLYYLFLVLQPHLSKAGEVVRVNSLKLFIVGSLAAFIVALGGNLHTIYVFTSGYPNETPKPFWQLSFGFYPERYWYPNATRFIANTIHEFPIYSFVVADLHGHVSDIPFVLLIIALLLNLIAAPTYKTKEEESDNPSILSKIAQDIRQHTYIPFPYLVLLGILIAVMYMTNAWDGLIYLVLTGLTFLYLNYKNSENGSLFAILYKTGSACLFLLFFFLLANFPFMISFRPFVSGIGVLCAPAFLLEKKIGPFLFETGKCQKSPLWMMALLWGFFYYSVLGYLIFVISHKFKRFIREESDKTRIKKGTKLGIFVLYFKIRLSRLFPFLDLLSPVDVFVLIMIFVSTLLLIFPEFFYIKDIYPAHYRANTMFKLGYQAFMMLGLSSAFIIFRLREYAAKYVLDFTYSIYNTLFIFLFTLIAIYPYFAVSSYYGRLQQYKGQDGTVWMHEQFADDYRAIIWLRKNISNQPVIAEAVGESYTDYARVSAYSGLPTIVGWPVHEWLWRGSYDEAGKRIPEVETLYQTLDLDAARKIIDKYQVEYIFVGSLEREKYPQLEADKFNLLGQVVFVSGSTKIYKISPQAGG